MLAAASSPYFGIQAWKGFQKWQKSKKYREKKVSDTFRNLLKRGCIQIEKKNRQLYIHLTDEGKKLAGWLQIDALNIKKPKKWDGKWRVVIFDISHLKKKYREAFRGKLKELGFCLLQKSVWVHPFDCKDEIALLKEFFGLSEKEIRLIIAETIEKDNELRKIFGIE